MTDNQATIDLQHKRATEQIAKLIGDTMDDAGMSRGQLAEKLFFNVGSLHDMLDDMLDVTLDELVDIFAAMGKAIDFHVQPMHETTD